MNESCHTYVTQRYGWFQWYCRFYQGRRTSDDIRQISRINGVGFFFFEVFFSIVFFCPCFFFLFSFYTKAAALLMTSSSCHASTEYDFSKVIFFSRVFFFLIYIFLSFFLSCHVWMTRRDIHQYAYNTNYIHLTHQQNAFSSPLEFMSHLHESCHAWMRRRDIRIRT